MHVLFTGGYGRFCAGNHRPTAPTAGGSLLECGQGRPTRFHRPPEVPLRPDESVEAEILKFTCLQSHKCPTRSPKYPLRRSRRVHRHTEESLKLTFSTPSSSRVRCCLPFLGRFVWYRIVQQNSQVFDDFWRKTSIAWCHSLMNYLPLLSSEGSLCSYSIKGGIEDQAFLRSYVSPHPLPPSRASKLFLFLSLPVWRRSRGRGGGGWARNQIIRPRDSLDLYKAFNTLCLSWYPSIRWVHAECLFYIYIIPNIQYAIFQRFCSIGS